MRNLALALGFPQIWQLLSITAITAFVILVSSNYFCFTIPSGPICTRLCQNISLFLKKKDHEITLNRDVRCPCSVARSLNYQPFPPSDPPAKCGVFFSPLWSFSIQEKPLNRQLPHCLPLERYRQTWKREPVSWSQSVHSIWAVTSCHGLAQWPPSQLCELCNNGSWGGSSRKHWWVVPAFATAKHSGSSDTLNQKTRTISLHATLRACLCNMSV